jgi:hypothetical protein
LPLILLPGAPPSAKILKMLSKSCFFIPRAFCCLKSSVLRIDGQVLTLNWFQNHGCPVMVLLWLLCPGCPAMAVLSSEPPRHCWLSRLFFHSSPI